MTENPSRMTPAMCSALFAASFAKWQRRYNNPIAAPPAAQRMLPMSLARAGKMLQAEEHRTDSTWNHTTRCVERMLRRCGHPDHAYYFSEDADCCRVAPLELRSSYRRSSQQAAAFVPEDTSWVDSDIDFDAPTWTTKVTAWSAFTEVSRTSAEVFFQLAKPVNWSKAGGFFKRSARGKWDPVSGTFRTADGDLGTNYQLFEEAEWSLSPEMSGGFMNILEITEKDWVEKGASTDAERAEGAEQAESADFTFQQNVLTKLFDDDAKTAASMREFTKGLVAEHRPEPDPYLRIAYDYGLHRSLRSRIIGGWRSGGLSKDDGTYKAAWYPLTKDSDVGLLCIEIHKALAFSRQVDVFDDYSSLLNLMAPALGSLLVEQLAHDGIYTTLRGTGSSSAAVTATSTRNA